MSEQTPEEIFADLEAVAVESAKMPPGPARDKRMANLRTIRNQLIEAGQLPVEPLAPEKYLLDILDYAPGLIRAGVGEAAVAARNIKKGQPVDTKQALSNLGKAFFPFGEPAPDIRSYTDRLGVKGQGYAVSDIPGAKEYITPGGMLDFTTRGVGEFATGVVLDPAGPVKSFIKGRMAKNAAKATEGMTAEQLKKKLGEEIAKQEARSGASKFLEGAGKMALDPAEALGQAAYKFRFRNADKATKAAGKKPFSETYLENVKPGITQGGITSGGLAEDVNAIVNAKDAAVDAMHLTPGEIPQVFETPASTVLEPLNAGGPAGKNALPGVGDKFSEAAEDIRDEFRRSALRDPGAARIYQDRLAEGASPNAFIQNPAEPGVFVQAAENIPEGGIPAYPVNKNAQWNPQNPKMLTWGKGIPDPLEVVEPAYSPEQLRYIGREYQTKAAASGKYGRSGITEVKSKTDLRNMEQLRQQADLQDAVASKARQEEMRLLDEAQPGLGGQVFKEYKDMSSALAGAPFIDRPFVKGANVSTRGTNFFRGFNRAGDIAADLLKDTGGALTVVGGKLMLSPVTQYGLQPAVRYQIQEYLNERNQQNPWSNIKNALEE